MDHIIAPFRSRAASRNHRYPQYTLTERELERDPNPYEHEEHPAGPLLLREHKRRTMSNLHRRFHRRAPEASGTTAGTRVKTVNVEVVATLDTAGNVVAQATVTQSDATAPTLPVTNATNVSVLSATIAIASTPAVPSIASLPSETQSAVPSTSALSSQPSVPATSAEPTIAVVAALPSVPSVSAVLSVSMPSVPSVPAFPSTLTVPAYPFASSSTSVDAVMANAVSASASLSASSDASSSPTKVVALTVAGSASSSQSSTSDNTSSTSSVLASSPTLSLVLSGSTFSLPSGAAASQYAISSGASDSGSSLSGASVTTSARSYYSATTTESHDTAGSSTFYGGGGGDGDGDGWNAGTGTATAGSPTGTIAAIADDQEDSTGPLDTPQVVGSVVGSLAGAALILAIILILLRRHKRGRQTGGALQLTDSHPTNHEQTMRQVQTPAAARASLVPSAFLNRFSGLSRSTADTSTPTERSFQRVSGRKLPSAFSEGMTSDQFSRGGIISGSSFYQDDHGTYGGPGDLNKEYGGNFEKEIGETSFAGGAGTMNLRPSPARTPVIRHPDENPFNDTNRSTLSPPMSPNPFMSPNPELSPRAALGRSLHSADGSRSSRFTENV